MSKTKMRLTNQRRDSIKEMLDRDGEVIVGQLADIFNVSLVTIRTDLNEMAKENLLHRVHSGAVSIKNPDKDYFDATINERMNINRSEKIAIAKACAALIQDGDTVMIDSGTTNVYVARELATRNGLTIVTNAILVAQEFLYSRSNKVILLGGDTEHFHQFTYGKDATTQLQKYRADKLILATDGISVKNGFTTLHHQEADLSLQMIKRANQLIVATDHTKLGKEGFSFIAPISYMHLLVTDAHPSSSLELDEIKRRNISVLEV